AAPRVGDAPLLEEQLQPAVLAEAAVERDEGDVEVDAVELPAVLPLEVDRDDLVADAAERLCDRGPRAERYVALRRASAHEDADDRVVASHSLLPPRCS